MNVPFFETLAPLLKDMSKLSFSLQCDNEGKIIVAILPTYDKVKDKAASLIPPITLTGTSQELDENFFSAITAPLQKTNSFFSGVASFEKNMEEVKAKSDMEKAEKEKMEKEKKSAQEKYEKLEKEVKELIESNFHIEADKKLRSFLKAHPTLPTSCTKKGNDLLETLAPFVSQGDLFATA
jgi:PRTRC genetic system protein E